MGDLRVGKAQIAFEGIRKLKNDAEGIQINAQNEVSINDNLKASMAKDGYDEIIFQKGDELFVAYTKNMDLDAVNLNLDPTTFDPDTAYDKGQLSLNGDAVRVLHLDDENKDSFWVAPYKSVGKGVKSLINSGQGKSAVLGFVAGAASIAVYKNLDLSRVTGYSNYGAYTKPLAPKVAASTWTGTSIGAVAGALKGGAESGHYGESILAGGIGYGLGVAAGAGADELVKLAAKNPKVTGIAAGVTALVVGTGIALDYMSDSDKPATMRVINRISEK